MKVRTMEQLKTQFKWIKKKLRNLKSNLDLKIKLKQLKKCQSLGKNEKSYELNQMDSRRISSK